MTRRGLTLIETLVAAALLTLVATAVAALLADVRRLSAPAEPEDARFVQLSLLADAALADPAAFELPRLRDIDSAPIPLLPPEHFEPPTPRATVRKLPGQAADGSLRWLCFEAADEFVVRAIVAPREDRP